MGPDDVVRLHGTDEAPHLGGGYATHLYLHPKAVVHKVRRVSRQTAVLFIRSAPVSVGRHLPRTTIGSKVVVLGARPTRPRCAIAAKLAGASLVIITGLTRDRHKLDLAIELGADVAIDGEREDLVARVRDSPCGADVRRRCECGRAHRWSTRECVPTGRHHRARRRQGTHGSRLSAATRSCCDGITVIGRAGLHRARYREALSIIDAGVLPRSQAYAPIRSRGRRARSRRSPRDRRRRPINVVIRP